MENQQYKFANLFQVRDDQKTHKNPSLREGPKPFVKQTETAPVRAPTRESPERPPKFALEGKKWFIEYQKDKPSLVVDNAKMDQSVYIFKCQNIVVQVKVGFLLLFILFFHFFLLYSLSFLLLDCNYSVIFIYHMDIFFNFCHACYLLILGSL